MEENQPTRRIVPYKDMIYYEEPFENDVYKILHKARNTKLAEILKAYDYTEEDVKEDMGMLNEHKVITLYHFIIMGDEGLKEVKLSKMVGLILYHHASAIMNEISRIRANSVVQTQDDN